MAWKIDLTDVLYTFDPCFGCEAMVTISSPLINPPFMACPHHHRQDFPCRWEEKREKVAAFFKKANAELAEILN